MSSEAVPLTIAPAAAPDGTVRVNRWLFYTGVDLAAFLGSAALSLLLLWIGMRAGLLVRDTPDWTWVTAVLLIDVAHVWSTAFIVYFDAREFRRRLWLYTLVPVLAFSIGVGLHLCGEMVFWRVLAYLAVFHFVRQQWGWVAMYRGRLRERGSFGLWLDRAAIYLATCYPLIHWHAHLDTSNFKWFRTGDFAGSEPVYILNLPLIFDRLNRLTAPVYWTVLALYTLRAVYLYAQGRGNPGKDVVVFTTALCWYVGIVAFNSDYAFTVTNVVIHGIPYFVLVFWYWRLKRAHQGKKPMSTWRLLLIFVATLWLLAYVEELLWHRGRWHEREWLFGGPWQMVWQMGPWTVNFTHVLVPLLAVPQITHYILDGFIWRRKSNPDLALLSGKSPV